MCEGKISVVEPCAAAAVAVVVLSAGFRFLQEDGCSGDSGPGFWGWPVGIWDAIVVWHRCWTWSEKREKGGSDMEWMLLFLCWGLRTAGHSGRGRGWGLFLVLEPGDEW